MSIRNYFFKFNKIMDYFLQKYFFDFFISICCIFVSFLFAKFNFFSIKIQRNIIFLCTIIQIFLRFKYFLYSYFSYRKYWNIIFFIFTLLIISIIYIGSLWIMRHLNH